MARNPCGCVGTECSCKIISSDGTVLIAGKGTAAQPYDLTADQGNIAVVDTPTINLTKAGDGSTTNPYTISAEATVATMELTDVNHSVAPTAGQILVFDGTMYTPGPAVTATPGAINHDTTLKGDGAAATPLGVALDPNGLLQGGNNGVGLSPSAVSALTRAARPFPAPQRMLRTNPYVADGFPSGTWIQILNGSFPGMPAGWYDISGAIQTADTTGGMGPFARGTEGMTRINATSAGGPVTTTNNSHFIPGYPEGQRSDYWTGTALSWTMKGTYHHTGGQLNVTMDSIMIRDGASAAVWNPGTFLVVSCISLD